MINKEEITMNRLASPLWLFLFLLLAIFSGEMLIMFVILPLLFGDREGIFPNMADSLLLTLIIAPFLWLLIVRPLRDAAITITDKSRQLMEVQEELLRKEKLAVLGQLSGSVGHELRNPLGVISNAVYFLKIILSEANEDTKEYLDIIKLETDSSLRIITDLLDFARTRPPQRQAVAPGELVRQNLARCAIPENTTISVNISEDLPKLKVDPHQLGQVLMNLITNAVQAMPNGGSMNVSARWIKGSRFKVQGSEKTMEHGTSKVEPDADFVEISIEDSGDGIAQKNMEKLFQPLFTTKARGIGLGLVVCKNLVEANGGRIVVESTQGKGTTFTMLLPIKEERK